MKGIIISKAFIILACSGIFWAYYKMVLRQQHFHAANRFYLLASVLLPLFIPFLEIEVGGNLPAIKQILPQLPLSASAQFEDAAFGKAGTDYWDTTTWWAIFYSLVALVLAYRFIKALHKVVRLRFASTAIPQAACPVATKGKAIIVDTNDGSAPFSFFRWVFWHTSLDIYSAAGRQVLQHELAHVRQWHSTDRLLMEMSTIFCWWNPFFWLAKKELATVHEFLADRHACQQSSMREYCLLLLSNTFQTQLPLLSNPFFHSSIKRRLFMLTNQKSTKWAPLRLAATLPLLAVVVAVFSFTKKPTDGPEPKSSETVTVVIDAGHGGSDRGVLSASGIMEKDITLAIAKLVKEQAATRNLRVILTREGDELPVPGNVNASLKKRAALAATNDAGLFVSLHVSASPEDREASMSGFHAIVPNGAGPRLEKSRQLGSALLAGLAPLGLPVENKLFQQEANSVYVLEKNAAPSVLLEMGYLTSPTDQAFITNVANRQKIAAAILDGIVAYSQQIP